MPLDIFDPQHYARVRLPANAPGALSLPPWCYTTPEYFQREVERIFMKTWNFIGRVERVEKPGDYIAFDFTGVPVIVVRDKDNKIRAFANTCRHRGARLLNDGEGNCRAIKCPYHAWVYGLDGALIGVQDMDDAKSFEKKDYGLIPIRLETWGGYMFICFDPDAKPLSAHLGDLPAKIDGYRLESMRPRFRREHDIACNWKFMVENFLEYYHTPYLHLRSVYQKPVNFLGQAGAPMVVLPAEQGTGDYVFFFMPHEGTRALLAGDTGFPLMENLPGRIANGTTSGCILPSAMMSFHQDCTWFLEIYPIAHNRTKVVQVGCFPEDVVNRPDFEEVSRRYFKRWDLVMGEDVDMLPKQQKGAENSLAVAGPVCHVEDKIHAIRHRWLNQVIGNSP